MTKELYWLTLTVLMTTLFFIPYILDRIISLGIWPALSEGKPQPGRQSAWADRAMMAHQNAIENLMIFAPAVLIANALGVSTPATKSAVVAYFFARLVHYVVYIANVPVMRTIAFGVALVTQVAILLSLLCWI